jgi:hypothetical protein
MSLKCHSFIAAAAVAMSSAAMAQTTMPSTTTTTPTTQSTTPDEAVPGHSATPPGQAQTTPGQTQAVPGEASQATPAVTGQTPSTQAAAQVTQATAADVKKGASVYDPKGELVGKIESVSAKGAVLNTGTTRAVIPVASFGKSEKGLVVSMTKAEIDAAGKKSSTK